MIWSFLKSRRDIDLPEEAFTSQIDRLTYAIGDIHGCNDLFQKLLKAIKRDANALGEKPRIVLLGDYVDRGPHSDEVLDTIVQLQYEPWCDLVTLLGNHEMVFLKFVVDNEYGPTWIDFGGAATLSSYGLPSPKTRGDPGKWRELRRDFVRLVPPTHLKLLSDAKLKFIAGDYLFVHGGVRPGVPLEEQSSDTLLWIRDDFLSAEKACDYVVVHGHSARAEPENLKWRIGVDTGAYATGVLTAVRLQGRERHLMSVTR